MNNEYCECEKYNLNCQSPLSKATLDNIIDRAKEEFIGYKVILSYFS